MIRQIWNGLTKPSDFSDDWYGYLTNQFSHIGVGIFLAWLTCLAAFIISGDMPYRIHVFIFLGISYFFKELIFDKWQGKDTIEDVLFVVFYGAGGTLASFKQMDQFSSDVVFNIYSALPIFIFSMAHLTYGTVSRIKK